MERSALAAIGVLLAACGDGQFGPTSLGSAVFAPGASLSLKVADYPALSSVGGVAGTTLAGVPIAIGRTSAATYAIWSMQCPHQAQQVQVSGAGFRCPGHNATWNANGVWTGGQVTGNLTVIPSTFDTASGILSVVASAAPSYEQDFTIDLTDPAHAALVPVGGWAFFTRPLPSGATTKLVVINTPLMGYQAYGAACGHQGRYLSFNNTLGHWRCPEHAAEYDIYGKKLKDANENRSTPTAFSLVMLTVSQAGTTLRVQGNSPQGSGG